jgi:curved DNA-binding protein CbpA
MAERSLYEIMMLHPSATAEVVNAVYRALAKQYHPDHAGVAGSEQMAMLNEAYAVLRDPQKRARYDEILSPGIATTVTRSSVPTSASATATGASATATGASATDTTATATSLNGSSPPGSERSFNRESMPGATNLKYESGGWAVRPPDEPTPAPSAYGEAGAPPSYLPAAGSAISFGRYRGWTVSQVAAYDRNYVEWLSRTMAGRTYRDELSRALAR